MWKNKTAVRLNTTTSLPWRTLSRRLANKSSQFGQTTQWLSATFVYKGTVIVNGKIYYLYLKSFQIKTFKWCGFIFFFSPPLCWLKTSSRLTIWNPINPFINWDVNVIRCAHGYSTDVELMCKNSFDSSLFSLFLFYLIKKMLGTRSTDLHTSLALFPCLVESPYMKTIFQGPKWPASCPTCFILGDNPHWLPQQLTHVMMNMW